LGRSRRWGLCLTQGLVGRDDLRVIAVGRQSGIVGGGVEDSQTGQIVGVGLVVDRVLVHLNLDDMARGGRNPIDPMLRPLVAGGIG
jgi:hypothetical protein